MIEWACRSWILHRRFELGAPSSTRNIKKCNYSYRIDRSFGIYRYSGVVRRPNATVTQRRNQIKANAEHAQSVKLCVGWNDGWTVCSSMPNGRRWRSSRTAPIRARDGGTLPNWPCGSMPAARRQEGRWRAVPPPGGLCAVIALCASEHDGYSECASRRRIECLTARCGNALTGTYQ